MSITCPYIADLSIQQAENHQRLNTEENDEQSKTKLDFEESDPQPTDFKKLSTNEGIISKSSIDLSKFI